MRNVRMESTEKQWLARLALLNCVFFVSSFSELLLNEQVAMPLVVSTAASNTSVKRMSRGKRFVLAATFS